MFGVVSVLLVLAVLGAAIAVLTGVATTFKELGMLYSIGGWPGRLAAVHGLVWLTALLYTGAPERDWIAALLIGIVLLGTLCAPFYINNRRLLATIRTREAPASSSDLGTSSERCLPVSGTVRLDADLLEDTEEAPWEIDPVTAPFTATECAAYEWAVKKKQRLSRGTTYSTVDHGANAGEFVLETSSGIVGVTVDTPKLLFVFDGSLTGYATTTDTPSHHEDPPGSGSVLSSLRSSELKYCESTVADGDPVTVVGPVERERKNGTSYPTVIATDDTQTYFIDADYDTVKRAVDDYLRWTPQVAIATLLGGWLYIAVGTLF